MKKLKDGIARLLYGAILLLVKLIPAKKGERHLLLIKTDEIGDYILFRNLFKYFKEADKYKGYKTTLVGNLAWKKLYDEYDQNAFENVVWLDKNKFKKDLPYRFSFLNHIRHIPVSDIINCVFSRSLNIDDAIASVAKSTHKIAMVSDNTNRGENVKNYDHAIYTQILDAGDEKIFDALRNRNFVSLLLQLPHITIDTKFTVTPKNEMPGKAFFVFFIGAGNPERKWPIANFLETANYVHQKYGLIPVICGGPADEQDAAGFTSLYKEECINLTGKTTLPHMVELISKAKFLVCVDTGALHIAAAVGCPVIGLYSGKFYGRFAPYPVEITEKFYPVYPDFVDELIAKKDPVLYNTFIMKNNTMKLIQPGKIEKYIDKVMGALPAQVTVF